MKELNDKVKEKLAELAEVWADVYLNGKPALLVQTIYFHLERVLAEKTEEIERLF